MNAGEIEYIGQVISLAIADGIKAGMLAVEAEKQQLQAAIVREQAFPATRAERIENAARILATMLCRPETGQPYGGLYLDVDETHALLSLRRELGLPVEGE